MSKAGTYWYTDGYNRKAIAVTVISAAVAVFPVLFGDLPGMTTAAQYSWFIGCGLSFVLGVPVTDGVVAATALAEALTTLTQVTR